MNMLFATSYRIDLHSIIFCLLSALYFVSCTSGGNQAPADISGELKVWHNITLTFDGPEADEMDENNPFLHYRLVGIFTQGDRSFQIPGYFAADGDAANSSATAGNKWRLHFVPDQEGIWEYQISFKKGDQIAISNKLEEGESADYMDGLEGSLEIGPTDKLGRDFRAHGRLSYVGKHYYQFEGSQEYFLKVGADAPENLLAYADFDGTFHDDGQGDKFIKNWEPHVQDWKEGDPSWQDGKGKGLVGAINYLAGQGMNAFSFLTMNIEGDDKNVFPYTTYEERLRMDVSKLDQWDMLFAHGDQLGMFLHFKTQEAENQGLLDEGELGTERKLYYRELIARFGHHLALNWNLGEENGAWQQEPRTPQQTTAQRQAMAAYFYETDPYKHPITIHNGAPFDDMLGNPHITGPSIQTHKPDFSLVHGEVLKWRELSTEAGRLWVNNVDEPGDATHALLPDSDNPEHDDARQNALWGTFMAGGAGIEWYFGYAHDHSDLTCEDWRSRQNMWDQSRYARAFFIQNKLPFWEMEPNDEWTASENDYVFFKPGEVYVIYQKEGASFEADLSDTNGSFEVKWFNPRTGQFHEEEESVNGGSTVSISAPPDESDKDWVVLIQST